MFGNLSGVLLFFGLFGFPGLRPAETGRCVGMFSGGVGLPGYILFTVLCKHYTIHSRYMSSVLLTFNLKTLLCIHIIPEYILTRFRELWYS